MYSSNTINVLLGKSEIVMEHNYTEADMGTKILIRTNESGYWLSYSP